jgi:predicted GNAT superfamily acetyltransferase
LAEIKERSEVSSRAQIAESNIVVRRCTTVEEFQACVALQKEVWKYSDADVIPVRLFVVASKIGGQIIGSFDDDVLVGFVLSIPGSRGGHSYLHSQMLAVRESYRNFGLGRRMKLAQREEALERGFKLMEWTFDPLEIKNAYLNIEKLGAIARRYSVNQYGNSSSPLQGGLPTDRLVAEWWLGSDRVRTLLETGSTRAIKAEKTISVPAQIYAWKASETKRPQALNVQQANREQFLDAFSRGLAVLGYERDSEGNGKFLLGKPEEEFSF